VLDIADMQYKTYASLKNEDVACKPDPIGTHIILVISDGYIPFVKGSGSVKINKNIYNTKSKSITSQTFTFMI
jgi:hypothetical protein